eukprot:NODE_312_length_10013_cov_0.697801.p1 type:complete len:615 gc:universal NODE_312_length_10013_cov_0.697801:4271-6115(+)
MLFALWTVFGMSGETESTETMSLAYFMEIASILDPVFSALPIEQLMECINVKYHDDPNLWMSCLPNGFNWGSVLKSIRLVPASESVPDYIERKLEKVYTCTTPPHLLKKRSLDSPTTNQKMQALIFVGIVYYSASQYGCIDPIFKTIGATISVIGILSSFLKVYVESIKINIDLIAKLKMYSHDSPVYRRISGVNEDFLKPAQVLKTNKSIWKPTQYKKYKNLDEVLKKYKSIWKMYESIYKIDWFNPNFITDLEPASLVNSVYYAGVYLEIVLKKFNGHGNDLPPKRNVPKRVILVLKEKDYRITLNNVLPDIILEIYSSILNSEHFRETPLLLKEMAFVFLLKRPSNTNELIAVIQQISKYYQNGNILKNCMSLLKYRELPWEGSNENSEYLNSPTVEIWLPKELENMKIRWLSDDLYQDLMSFGPKSLRVRLKQSYLIVFGNPEFKYSELLSIEDRARQANTLFYAAMYIATNKLSSLQINQIWKKVLDSLRTFDRMRDTYGKIMNDLFHKVSSEVQNEMELTDKISQLLQDFAVVFYVNRPGALKTQREAIRAILVKYDNFGKFKEYKKMLPEKFDDVSIGTRPFKMEVIEYMPLELVERVESFQNGQYL